MCKNNVSTIRAYASLKKGNMTRCSELHISIYEKRDDLKFTTTKFQFWGSNINSIFARLCFYDYLYDIPGFVLHMDALF